MLMRFAKRQSVLFALIITCFLLTITACANPERNDGIPISDCPGKTYSSEDLVDLLAPSEAGATYLSADCYHIYGGSSGATPYFYKISISNHDTMYNTLPRKVYNSVIVGDYIWGTEGPSSLTCSTIQQIDKNTLEVVWSDGVTVRDGRAIVYDGKHIWIADRDVSRKLHRIDPVTRKIMSYAGIVLAGARHFVFDGTYLWLSCSEGNAVLRINPEDQSVTTVAGITGAWGICYDGENIIVAGLSGYICKINPITATITADITLANCSWLCHCSFDGNNVWIADNAKNEIRIIDRVTLALLDTRPTLSKPLGAMYDGYYQWIPVENNIRIMKMTP